jgi:hypothetical protein
MIVNHEIQCFLWEVIFELPLFYLDPVDDVRNPPLKDGSAQ